MTTLFTDRADYWGFKPDNFLINYCNANGVAVSDHYVEETAEENGLRYFSLYHKSDRGDLSV